ncbi:tetratricopeptide repeat protein [Plantactinospora sp. KLBMP9567]|uniref:tetratricopeptide repeat protein n=1 Tax=Plantactinospora sp. KLBMP9567 TaxID=3085900 RepID=UPI002981FB23|nr:tetratricopeptide repeat protein [Plantactinospora sp. KLBMP9567]MDW5329411.1 tetratricopeptide repeat protein [Plantactinospora sp. KLBMP9567]
MQDWERRVAEAWASIDDYEHREDDFRALIDSLAAELPADDPVGAFERACAWDSTGHSDRAVPLYRWALDHGLIGYRRRRAVIQMSSSLRNIGQAELAVTLLKAERNLDPATLDELTRGLGDAISAVLALCLVDTGREREAVSVAVGALAPHLPRYQRSMGNYARLLLAPDDKPE